MAPWPIWAASTDPWVRVVVDRDDGVDTAKAIHALAARERAVLAVTIAPKSEALPAVIWAILRALGKRIEYLGRSPARVYREDAQRWLRAHGISEVIVLCAQHLGGDAAAELRRFLTGLGITLTLVYGGTGRAPPATTTLSALVRRARAAPRAAPRPQRWPEVPRSHPLRFRYDCSQQLTTRQFARVDRLLLGSLHTLGGSRWTIGGWTSAELARAIGEVSTADDPEQAYVRRCGAEMALILHRLPVPSSRPLRLRGQRVTHAQLRAIHAYTSAAEAGYRLAELITGLPDELLELIGGDQITENTIVGCPVPDVAKSIVRALDDHTAPALSRPGSQLDAGYVEPQQSTAAQDNALERALAQLLRGHGEHIRVQNTTLEIRRAFDVLVDEEVLKRDRGVYRASRIALYSRFLEPLPPSNR